MDKTNKTNNLSEKLTDYIEKLAQSQPYFRGVLNSVKRGETEVSFIRQEVNKHIQLEWIEAIEMCLVSLDNVIRTPSRYIEERDEVKPIELSHSIRPRSLIHLAQHTNYISEVKDDTITPNRILNVYNEETLLTYENRFVNTLIHRLFNFVNSRYVEMVSKGMENGSVLSIKTAFKDANFNGKVDLSISVAEAMDNSENFGDSALKRAGQLNSVITSYANSEFIKSMGDNFVRPPIMRTNALLKNKDLKLCLDLWQFIESYDKVGYTITVARKAQSPNQQLIDKLYDDLALQYVAFKHEIADADDKIMVIDEDEVTLEPLVNAEFEEIDPKSLDLYHSEYRKIAPIPHDVNQSLNREKDLYIFNIVKQAFLNDRAWREKFDKKIQLIKNTRVKLVALKEWEDRQKALAEKRRRLLEAEKTSVKDIEFKYDKSFQARLIQGDDNLKEFYCELRNRLLSYEKTKSRISWAYENINKGRNTIAKFRIRGNNLYLFLQIEPETVDKTRYKIKTAKGRLYETTPCEYKINNKRKMKLGIELIDKMCKDIELDFLKDYKEDYNLEYRSTEELILDDLIIDLNAPKKFKAPKSFSTKIVAKRLKKKPDYDDFSTGRSLYSDNYQFDNLNEEKPIKHRLNSHR